MTGTQLKNFANCLKISQIALFTFCSISIDASSLDSTKKAIRVPASSTVPDEEVIVPPAIEAAWVEVWLQDDNEGIMKKMRNDLALYEQKDEFAKNWNLESTNATAYKTPKASERKKMISKNLLKYADKKLSGEIKNAEEGSTLHQVGKIEKAVRPQSTVQLSKNYAIKFKARVLQGKGIMEVRNPYIEFNTTLTLNGRVSTVAVKEFKSIGFRSGAEFQLKNSVWIAFMDQELTKNLKARVSTTNRSPAFAHKVEDQRVEMIAAFPFEF